MTDQSNIGEYDQAKNDTKPYDSSLTSSPKEVKENVTLEEICEFMMRGKQPTYVDESEIRALNQKAIRENTIEEKHLRYHDPEVDMFENRFIKEGDIVINSTGKGTVGRTHYFRSTPKNLFADSHVTILRTDESEVNSEYLYYLLSTPRYKEILVNGATGSTGQVELNKGTLQNIEITYPDIETQEDIVSILRPMGLQIENNRNMNKTLLEMMSTIFGQHQSDMGNDLG